MAAGLEDPVRQFQTLSSGGQSPTPAVEIGRAGVRRSAGRIVTPPPERRSLTGL